MNQFESYETQVPVLCLSSQTAVECKIVNGGEFLRLLAINASVIPTGKEVFSGEFRYSGKLLFSVVYEDNDGEVRRIERGAEFSQTIERKELEVGQIARLRLKVVKTNVRRENGNLYLNAIVSPEVEVFAPTKIEYLRSSDLIEKQGEETFFRPIEISGTLETEDELEGEYLNDVLTHSEQIYLEKVECSLSSVRMEGKIALVVTALKESGICSLERLVPFTAELPCESAREHTLADGEGILRSVTLSVDSDEGKGKTTIVTNFQIELVGRVWEEEKVTLIEDAFSSEREITLRKRTISTEVGRERICLNERIYGVCASSETLDFSSELKCITSVRATARLEEKIEGTIYASAIFERDGGKRKVDLTCPFEIQTNERGRIEVCVCSLKVTQKKEGELEAEATLKISIVPTETREVSVIEGVELGGCYPPVESGISVFLPTVGDDLWDTAKRLKISPEEVQKRNPELIYPLTGKERILLYRKNGKTS